MGQALYRKWRPQTFDDVAGQDHIVQTLRYALQTGHVHHAYLLAGPRGTGKTTTARLIAKAVNCLAPEAERPCNQCEICTLINEGRLMDLVEIDAASNTGVDNIRDLLEKVGFRPTQAAYKVYVVDEVHMLSTAAFNALLKTLEEPPAHVLFVLATTEVHKIPETILSRCQRFEFRRIPLGAIIDRLRTIATSEGIEVEPEALELIARAATGSMRDAISLFDQLAASGDIKADYVRLMLGAERREVVQALLTAWVNRDLTAGLQVINQAVDGGADPRQLARQTADFLRGLLLMRLGAGHTWTDPTAEERRTFAELAGKADPDRLVDAVRRFSEAAAKQRTGWQPQLPLELAFVEATLTPAETVPTLASAPQPATQPTSGTARSTAAPAPEPRSGRTQSNRVSESAQDPVPNDPAVDNPASRDPTPGNPTPKAAAAPVSERDSAESATPVQDGQAGVDLELAETIKANWDDVVKQVQPVALGALLRDATVGGSDDSGRLVLAFQHTFHCDKVSEEANVRKLEEYLSRTFRRPIILHCLLAEDWQVQRGARSRSRQKAAPAAPAVDKQRAVPLEEDELIRRAQEELGAVARVNE